MKEFEVDIKTFAKAININSDVLRSWLNYNWKLQVFTKRKRNPKYRQPLMHVTINDEFIKLFLDFLSTRHNRISKGISTIEYENNFLEFIENYQR